jgi:hypothetical protein
MVRGETPRRAWSPSETPRREYLHGQLVTTMLLSVVGLLLCSLPSSLLSKKLNLPNASQVIFTVQLMLTGVGRPAAAITIYISAGQGSDTATLPPDSRAKRGEARMISLCPFLCPCCFKIGGNRAESIAIRESPFGV